MGQGGDLGICVVQAVSDCGCFGLVVLLPADRQSHQSQPQRHSDIRPGGPLMTYLVQVWRGVPQCGGLGWVTYGGPVSEARAHQLLALSQRSRPQHPHKLETICPG